MATREEIAGQMRDDNVRFLLAQFVDLNGSPKVKMVPVEHFEDVIDDGAGLLAPPCPVWAKGPIPTT